MMYRIIETDNFDGDYPDEKFTLFPMHKHHAEKIAKDINEAAGANCTRYWKVEISSYKLQPGFEP